MILISVASYQQARCNQTQSIPAHWYSPRTLTPSLYTLLDLTALGRQEAVVGQRRWQRPYEGGYEISPIMSASMSRNSHTASSSLV